jgi:hypothetical protein
MIGEWTINQNRSKAPMYSYTQERSSCVAGYYGKDKGPKGDMFMERKRVHVNGGVSPYYNAVYFPNSGRLYNVQNHQPVWIRYINGNHKRFNFGSKL